MTEAFTFELRTRLVFGTGSAREIGSRAHDLGFVRSLVVADRGLQQAGHVARIVGLLETAGIEAVPFHDFDINPDTDIVQRGADFARQQRVDSIIGLGGGSSLDCAKGINFILTNGGTIASYRGYGKAHNPMLPMLAVPTTAGTGSEAQSYAVITDASTKIKMACGDPKAAFRIAVLDPELTLSQPRAVTAAAGIDAMAHAIETAVTTRRNPSSLLYSREAFSLLNHHIETVLQSPDTIEARSAMQLGAFYAGVAIEHSMLGAAHACANPLTARSDIPHGAALAILIPCVVRWNAETDPDLYQELVSNGMPDSAATGADCADRLAERIVQIGDTCGFPHRLRDVGIDRNDLGALAQQAGQQWTGAFNPRTFGEFEALEIYQCAY